MDAYIRQYMKSHVSEQQPRPNGRARLLLIAASIQREQLVAKQPADRVRDLSAARSSPVDQAGKIHNLPLLWAVHVYITPIRNVT